MVRMPKRSSKRRFRSADTMCKYSPWKNVSWFLLHSRISWIIFVTLLRISRSCRANLSLTIRKLSLISIKLGSRETYKTKAKSRSCSSRNTASQLQVLKNHWSSSRSSKATSSDTWLITTLMVQRNSRTNLRNTIKEPKQS